jgi:DNA polymerase/3'-5' exonuclease PolX
VSTGEKRPHAEGWASAERFRELFAGTFEHWSIAGSVRRRSPLVGDVEHVVVPKFLDIETQSFLTGPAEVSRENRLWIVLDQLVASGKLARATYGETRTHRWGEKYRGVLFEGFKHEIFTADEKNLGPILAIRTGPAEFSEHLVKVLKAGGRYRQQEGYLRYAGGNSEGQVRACMDEREFFRLCGVPWLEPEQRDAYRPKSSQRSFAR